MARASASRIPLASLMCLSEKREFGDLRAGEMRKVAGAGAVENLETASAFQGRLCAAVFSPAR
jgi:hypothetical protein